MDKPNNIIEMLTNPAREEARLAMIHKSIRAAMIASVVQNIAVISAFTVLAILFKHWWIVLPSIMFMAIPKLKVPKRGEEEE